MNILTTECVSTAARERMPVLDPDVWLLMYGHWGDMFPSFGRAITEYGYGFGIAHYGPDSHIALWLARQWGCRAAVHVRPFADEDYNDLASTLFRKPIGFDRQPFMDKIAARAGLPPLRYCGIEYDRMARTGPQRWQNVVVSADCKRQAAQHMRKEDVERYFVFFPYSVEGSSCPIELHWRHWQSALKWLLEETGETFVLCGKGYDLPYVRHPRLINMLNRTPTMEHVFALIERSSGYVGTSAGASYFAVSNGIPALICENSSAHGSIFQTWLQPETRRDRRRLIPAFGKDSGMDAFQRGWRELFVS